MLQGSFLAHHQEAEYIMWQIVPVFLMNRLSVGLASQPSLLTVDSEVKQVPLATSYTQPPDDRLKMIPKTCRGVVT
jgi:hypothetical protein